MTVFLTTTVFQTAIYTFIIIRNVYFNVIFRKDPSFLHHFYQNYSHRTFSVIPFNSHTSHYTNIHTFYFLTMISNPPYHTGTPKIISVPHIRQTSFLSPYSPPFPPSSTSILSQHRPPTIPTLPCPNYFHYRFTVFTSRSPFRCNHRFKRQLLQHCTIRLEYYLFLPRLLPRV